MKIERKFTKPNSDVFATVDWEWRDIEYNGQTIRFEVPKQFSNTAATIAATKYARRKDVPVESQKKFAIEFDNGRENSFKQLAHRLALAWMKWGVRGKYFSGKDAQVFYDEMVYMLVHQMAAPNSPQWFNTGIFETYDIEKPAKGYFRVNPETDQCEETGVSFKYPQPHACFIQSIDDNMFEENGIWDLMIREGKLFKFGSGSGSNFDNVRGKDEPVSGGGVSSGLMSFLRTIDRSAGSVSSGGVTRRAAKMVCLSADHPDIEDFVMWKSIEEDKARALINQGYNPAFDADWQDGAYATVSGQNSNNSVRLTNEFMQRVADGFSDDEWNLIARTSGKVWNTISARELWNKLCYAAWRCADPGTQYDTTINQWHTTPKAGRINASNPCFTGDMRLLTDDGYKTFAELDGQVVRIVNKDGQITTSEVWCSGEKQIVRVLFDNGTFISCTPDHVFMTETGHECEAIELKGQKVSLYSDSSLNSLLVVDVLVEDGKQKVYDFNEPFTHWGVVEGVIVHNCSEYMYLDDTACNLASINLFKFYNVETQTFDVDSFIHAVRLWTITLEISVLMAQFPSKAIAINSYKYRTLGLGHLEGGTILMNSGIPYDSDLGRNILGAITAIMTGVSYATSAEMASEIGPFADFNELHRDDMLRVIRNHRRAAYNDNTYEELDIKPVALDQTITPKYLLDAAQYSWDHALQLGEKYGYRNAQTTVLAPTGTIGLLMDASCTGVEPEFALVKFKKLVGGGYFQFVNPNIPIALKVLGYGQDDIEKIVKYVEEHQTVEGSGIRNEHLPVFDCANKQGSNGTRFIHHMGHIKMMASVQPFLSGAISKTINMPNECIEADISDAYLQSWKLGLKATALYRDGSKGSQPLNVGKQDDEEQITNDTVDPAQIRGYRRRLPKRRTGITHEARIGGQKIFVRTGEYEDGNVGEFFVDIDREGGTIAGLTDVLATVASIALQYGVPLKELIDAMSGHKFEPAGIVQHDNIKMSSSITDFISRLLAMEYLGDTNRVHVKPEAGILRSEPATESNEHVEQSNSHVTFAGAGTCNNCGGVTKPNGTCHVCIECGTTTGCS